MFPCAQCLFGDADAAPVPCFYQTDYGKCSLRSLLPLLPLLLLLLLLQPQMKQSNLKQRRVTPDADKRTTIVSKWKQKEKRTSRSTDYAKADIKQHQSAISNQMKQ